MVEISSEKNVFARFKFLFLVSIQVLIFVLIVFNIRTSVLWILEILSFLPVVVCCLYMPQKRYAFPSLLLFFISQQAIFIFVNPIWGFSYGSDPINDYHIASLMMENSNFELGQLGYISRLSYSYYPLLHLFTSSLSKITGISLNIIAVYFIPLLTTILTSFVLFYLSHDLFNLDGKKRNLAVLFFQMSFNYTAFHTQFVRETFAFPFVLLSLWAVSKLLQRKHHDLRIVSLFYVFFITATLSHHISAYILVILIAIITLYQNLFPKSNRLNSIFFSSFIILALYSLYIAWNINFSQFGSLIEGLFSIFQHGTVPNIMGPYEPWRRTIALSYYFILAIITLVGSLKLLREKPKKWNLIFLLSFFVVAFILSALLRLSTSADPWGWTYYMSLRGSIWAFIGLSILVSIGLSYMLRINGHLNLLKLSAVILIIAILAVGKFSQYPLFISDPSIPMDVTYPSYSSALWLKENVPHGDLLLVAPSEIDNYAFEASRGIAPYAYLTEYFIEEEKGRTYERFTEGYIPFVGDYFEQFKETPDVDIIYSNNYVQIGYKNTR